MLPAGFFIGRYTAYTELQDTTEAVPVQVSQLDATLDTALGEIEMLRTQNEVDARALEMLRTEMALERERRAELEEGLSFYRSLVVSDEANKEIYLRKPELATGSGVGHFAYRIFVQQKQQKERQFDMVEGELTVFVSGTLDGEEVRYSLAELSEDFGDTVATLRFRYFQSIEGEMSLPEGFTPLELGLVARTSKPRELEVEEVYPWVLQERFIHVGQ